LTPLEAIQPATAHGPLTLGPRAPAAASSPKGFDANLTTLDGDPLADITILANPRTSPACGRRVAGSRDDLQRKRWVHG